MIILYIPLGTLVKSIRLELDSLITFCPNISYTSTSTSNLVSFMDDGNPLTTTIAMSFKETELLTKQDIDAGY